MRERWQDRVGRVEQRAEETGAIGEVLRTVVRELGRHLASAQEWFAEEWSRVVGESGRGTRVISWKGGVLTLGVESPAQLQESQFRVEEWKARWRLAGGRLPVDRIEIRVDRDNWRK